MTSQDQESIINACSKGGREGWHQAVTNRFLEQANFGALHGSLRTSHPSAIRNLIIFEYRQSSRSVNPKTLINVVLGFKMHRMLTHFLVATHKRNVYFSVCKLIDFISVSYAN
ncbi:hypothetical protein L798_00257 [Zootermopsis nevadensis]|uniref:Uncharacterized protein n=1 Tax=Zootermopsis nevadensis TaxID=136037 RepID=A0A067QL64_ZOONE|nr:hypothetical protein L798_00257 [Zootermopsis nevadensis]